MVIESNIDDPSELRPQGKRRKRKKAQRPKPRTETKENYSYLLDEMELYCMSRTTWEEAKTIVYMMEAKWGFDPPPPVAAALRRIKQKFGKLIYGPKIDSHDTIQGDKNNFQRGADLNNIFMSKDISAQDAIKELTNTSRNGKRQRKRRSQCIPSRKHDGEILSD